MNYTGIDYHKRYSVACTLDAQGRKLQEGRIDGNAMAAFAAYFKQLGGPSEVVIEACWNWGALYDVLEDIDGVAKVVLSHPAKNSPADRVRMKHVTGYSMNSSCLAADRKGPGRGPSRACYG